MLTYSDTLPGILEDVDLVWETTSNSFASRFRILRFCPLCDSWISMVNNRIEKKFRNDSGTVINCPFLDLWNLRRQRRTAVQKWYLSRICLICLNFYFGIVIFFPKIVYKRETCAGYYRKITGIIGKGVMLYKRKVSQGKTSFTIICYSNLSPSARAECKLCMRCGRISKRIYFQRNSFKQRAFLMNDEYGRQRISISMITCFLISIRSTVYDDYMATSTISFLHFLNFAYC